MLEIAPLASAQHDAAIALWHAAGLVVPWNDPRADLTRALDGPSSIVMAGTLDGSLVATAVVGHDVTPMASTIVSRPRCRTVDNAIASTSAGRIRKKSVNRISTADGHPPKCPASSPTRVPITTDSAAAARPAAWPAAAASRSPWSASPPPEGPRTVIRKDTSS